MPRKVRNVRWVLCRKPFPAPTLAGQAAVSREGREPFQAKLEPLPAVAGT